MKGNAIAVIFFLLGFLGFGGGGAYILWQQNSGPEVSVSVTVDRADRLDAIERELAEFCDVRLRSGGALACLVGRRLLENPKLVAEVLSAVHPTPLRMFCLGSSDINLTLVVDEADAESVVRRLHARFLEAAS